MPSFTVKRVSSSSIAGQKPGTSGLRKKTREFIAPNYLENFIQASFNALSSGGSGDDSASFTFPDTLLVGGDGRFYCREAARIIVRIAAANGVKRVWVARGALISTPAASAVIRTRGTKGDGEDSATTVCGGAFILTASHNPGGIDEDFGVKYNAANGGPAPERLTNLIYKETTTIDGYTIADEGMDSHWDIDTIGTTHLTFDDQSSSSSSATNAFIVPSPAASAKVARTFTIEVIDAVEDYVKLLSEVFDFNRIAAFLNDKSVNFRLLVDGLSGIAGPSIHKIFGETFNSTRGEHNPLGSVVVENATPLPDFGKGHPDPNLTYAENLVAKLGLTREGAPAPLKEDAEGFDMGVAFDGDADRNMILGRQFFVSPSDSVAIIAANADACIPFFGKNGGLKAVARSMPTSGALDFVARAKGIQLYEVPTGWKFFGNLMDSKVLFGKEDYTPMICGEESFGTGSNHVREKDGMWAALAWLSIISHKTQEKHDGGCGGPENDKEEKKRGFVTIQQIVEDHWREYGRNYYTRYDYEGLTVESAASVMAHVGSLTPSNVPPLADGNPCVQCDSFSYTDPVDGSVTTKQGLRIIFSDRSRFVLRESGTGSSGATLRLYMEQYMEPAAVRQALDTNTLLSTAAYLEGMVELALQQTRIAELTGRTAPTVIT